MLFGVSPCRQWSCFLALEPAHCIAWHHCHNEQELLINNRQTWHQKRKWIIVLPIWVWYDALQGWDAQWQIIQSQNFVMPDDRQNKGYCIWDQVDFFDKFLLMPKEFAFVWKLLHACSMRMLKVIVCLLAPMLWRRKICGRSRTQAASCSAMWCK